MKGFKKDGKFRPTGNRSKSSLSKDTVNNNHWKKIEEAGELKNKTKTQWMDDRIKQLHEQGLKNKNRNKEYIDDKVVVGDYSHRNAVLTKAEFDKYAEMIFPPEKVMHGHLTYESPKDRWFVYNFGKQEGLFKVDDNGDPIRDKKSLSEKRKWEMRNGLNSMDIAESSVKQESEIGGQLSDLQEHRLRRGVGSGDPESKTLDRIEGKFITEDKAKKYR